MLLDGLPESQDDLSTVLKGPPISIAIDAKKKGNQKYLKPALGFAKKAGVPAHDLEERDGFLYATVFQKGLPIKRVLPQLIQDALAAIDLPVAMRWGTSASKFIRPVHWILALLDKELVPVECFSVRADRYTYGHRYLSQNREDKLSVKGARLLITSISDYFLKLKNRGAVVLDHREREALVQRYLKRQKRAVIDPDLLNEAVFLSENPTLLKGKIEEKYLSLPSQVLVECMKKHQKYFPLYEDTGSDLNGFFVVCADSITAHNRRKIIKGFESVLRSRLDDAQYFFETDLKQPLASYAEKLKGILFQKNMGTLWDKKERMKRIARYLVKHCSSLSVPISQIDRAADLCKADLVTQMVYEFPSLQGEMGRIYAEKSGEKAMVAKAIQSHYWPLHAAGPFPDAPLGVVMSLSDKMDTVVASFHNSKIPTSSRDPLGIRRALNGILWTVLDQSLVLDFNAFICYSYSLFEGEPKNLARLEAFLRDRIRKLFEENSLEYDLVSAVLERAMIALPVAFQIATNLSVYRKQDAGSFKRVVETAVRVHRLAVKAKKKEAIQPALFCSDIEKKLFEEVSAIQSVFKSSSIAKQWDYLIALSDVLYSYFDSVLVMDSDKARRANRLAVLSEVDTLFCCLADFEQVEQK